MAIEVRGKGGLEKALRLLRRGSQEILGQLKQKEFYRSRREMRKWKDRRAEQRRLKSSLAQAPRFP